MSSAISAERPGSRSCGQLWREERDPEKLADFRDPRIKASREDIIASLCGNRRAELLFQAKQKLARYDFCQLQIAECDRELEQRLRTGLTVISEVGLDMSRWPSEQHFASWLGLMS